MYHQQEISPHRDSPSVRTHQDVGGDEQKGNPCICLSLPRGKAAVLEFDWKTSSYHTNYPDLFRPFFHKGITDFEDIHRMPSEGYEFLASLFDHLYLNGYMVTWRWGSLFRNQKKDCRS